MGIDARMLVKVVGGISDDEIRKYAYRIGSTFGAGRFMIFDKNDHTIVRVKEFWQDGPTIKPKAGETFLEVRLWGRYYGKGYERGDILFHDMLARWIEENMAPCQVWYGGDSSGVLAERFDEAARKKLVEHYWKVKREPYIGGYGSGLQIPDCPRCLVRMDSHSFMSTAKGTEQCGLYCGGCGLKGVAKPDGYKLEKWEELSKA